MAGSKTVFQQPIKNGLFLDSTRVSFPTADQGNDDSGNDFGPKLSMPCLFQRILFGA